MDEQVLTIRTAIRSAQTSLAASPSTTPRLDAEVLLGYVLSLTRTGLLSRLEQPLTEENRLAFRTLVARRLSGVSVAYLIGRRAFMDLSLAVGPGVLVPRPETELMVEWAIGFLRTQSAVHRRLVIDVGTGSGAIAVSIAEAFRDSDLHIVGCDISRLALQWAEHNRQQLGLTDRVDLVLGDLVCWLGSPATLIIANLPYLRSGQVHRNWEISMEPEIALDGGHDGLDTIRRLLADCGRVLAPDGAVALEIDPSQSAAVTYLMKQALPQLTIHVLHDLAGHDRFVIGSTC